MRRDYREVLDVGCGVGYTTQLIASHLPAAHVRGIDYDPRQIMCAQRLHSSLEFLVGDVQNLAFPDHSVDAIFVFDTLHHVEDYQQALREFHRVLRKRGDLYLVDVSRSFFNPVVRWIDNTQSLFTKGDMTSALQKQGFSLLYEHHRLFLFYLSARAR